MSKVSGTYVIQFADGAVIVCGNNYKSWDTHAVEFAWGRYQNDRPHTDLLVSVEYSDTPFIDDGGLKYANANAYNKLIRVYNLDHPAANRPSLFDMKLEKRPNDNRKLTKQLKYWGLI